MTGEKTSAPTRHGPRRVSRGAARERQPGGRSPAPGELALVQAFLNTHFDLGADFGADRLGSPGQLRGWLVGHGLLGDGGPPIGSRELAAARELRESLRALAATGGRAAVGAGRGADVPAASGAGVEAGGGADVQAAGGAGVEAVTGQARKRLDELAAWSRVGLRFGPAGPELIATAPAGFPAAAGRLLAISATAMLDGRWSRLKVCPGHHCGWLFYDLSRNRSGRWCAMSVCGGREKARAHYQRARVP